jgi:hypothetical protein
VLNSFPFCELLFQLHCLSCFPVSGPILCTGISADIACQWPFVSALVQVNGPESREEMATAAESGHMWTPDFLTTFQSTVFKTTKRWIAYVPEP